MQNITPCQRTITDRFPVASFVVHIPPSRTFEIACSTDASLFGSGARHRRTRDNFYTSRSAGLLRAAAGQATVLLPPDQLRRFAGGRRLYYVLGSYGMRGEQPEFSAPPDRPELIPSVGLSRDFTGRTLDRGRLSQTPAGRYGGAAPVLSWGGDLLGGAIPPGEVASSASPNPIDGRAVAEGLAGSGEPARGLEYDDGYPPELWNDERARDTAADERRDAVHDARARGAAPDSSSAYSYGNPHGSHELYRPHRSEVERYGTARRREDVPRPVQAAPLHQGSGRAPLSRPLAVEAEPPGAEDGTGLRALYGNPRRGRSVGADGGARFDAGGAPQSTPGAGRFGSPLGPRLGKAAAPLSAARYGRAAPAIARGAEAEAVAPPLAVVPSSPPRASVDDAYDDDSSAGGLAAVPPELASTGEALTIRRKLELLVPVADLASGAERYSALSGDVEYEDPTHPAYQRIHHGLHWGLLGFTQRSGAIGKVLLAAQRRAPQLLSELFGEDAEQLSSITTARQPDERVQPVAGAFVWQSPWLERFRAAGREPSIQAAQNEVAIEHVLDPLLPFAAQLGLSTDRALGLLAACTVWLGRGGSRRFVLDALSPLGEDMDKVARALGALGVRDLSELQARAGLPPDGRWTPETHAALLGALRASTASPFALLSGAEALDRLVQAAHGRRFVAWLEALRRHDGYRDAVLQIG
jgi:hypothetical protein